ncbi:MAG: alpha-amylase family glycosyl hydrolase [Oscillospiraceae bacterium]|nr:alpha-amylase family glycosyl hydrolase [Oscillospiraceae bacterium]
MIYIFDESDEYFRCPNEALETSGALTLRIKLRRGEAANPKVILYPDGGAAEEIAMAFERTSGIYDLYNAEIKFEAAGLYWYHFLIEALGRGTFTVPEYAGGGFQVTVYTPPASTPDWLGGGIIYHIFVDRFFKAGDAPIRPGATQRSDWGGCPYFLPDEMGIVKNSDFFGGDLNGIAEKLPYLEGLGVTCIYLSPVFEAASNHKYDTGDFMKVDQAFGGDEALERLCKEAHSCGIRVVLDGVFNHVGSDSRYFNRYGSYDDLGAYQSAESPYRSWFSFYADGSYESWWGIELLPSINEREASYKEFICGDGGVVSHWMGKGVSGWRLDVVDELPDEFLDPLCAAVRKADPNALIVGEVWEDASNKLAYGVRRRYFLGGQLDSVTNYPLKNSIIACVREGNVEQLTSTMSSLCRNYPKPALDSMMNILGTHDTMRILTALGGSDFPEGKLAMSNYQLSQQEREMAKQRLMLASALQFTLPGVPCVYYGDEAGMDGGADPFNRRCYPWGLEDAELLSWYRRLAKLRREHGCFVNGRYELCESRLGVFAFTRGGGASRILIAVNVSDTDRVLSASGFNYDLLKDEYTDALTVSAGTPGIFSIR